MKHKLLALMCQHVAELVTNSQIMQLTYMIGSLSYMYKKDINKVLYSNSQYAPSISNQGGHNLQIFLG